MCTCMCVCVCVCTVQQRWQHCIAGCRVMLHHWLQNQQMDWLLIKKNQGVCVYSTTKMVTLCGYPSKRQHNIVILFNTAWIYINNVLSVTCIANKDAQMRCTFNTHTHTHTHTLKCLWWVFCYPNLCCEVLYTYTYSAYVRKMTNYQSSKQTKRKSHKKLYEKSIQLIML